MADESEKNGNVQTNQSTQTESKGMSIAAMVLGIVSLVLCCIPYVSLPCSILAIIFAIVGKKKGGKGMAIAGLVLGIITLALWTLGLIFGAAFITSIFNSEMWNEALQNASYYQ